MQRERKRDIMKKFTINGREYKSKPFDFNMVCDLEDMGIEVDKMRSKQAASIRAYFAICSGAEIKTAGKEIEKHIINGGKLDDIADAMSEEMEKSDFFRSLSETAEEEDAESAKEQSEKK